MAGEIEEEEVIVEEPAPVHKTYRMRFDDQEAFQAAARAAGLEREGEGEDEGTFLDLQGDDYWIVEYGTFYDAEDTGEVDEEGVPIINSIPLPGYHVNMLTCNQDMIDAFEAFMIQPSNPRVVFAGYENDA